MQENEHAATKIWESNQMGDEKIEQMADFAPRQTKIYGSVIACLKTEK